MLDPSHYTVLFTVHTDVDVFIFRQCVAVADWTGGRLDWVGCARQMFDPSLYTVLLTVHTDVDAVSPKLIGQGWAGSGRRYVGQVIDCSGTLTPSHVAYADV
ncbi:hypothetical protein J6590_036206 [Homalodisca vitripennis]|nr:hypothetical protein J6590_036206 [Homalodisca vitripennis]